jgi:hypothetical protein
MSISLEHDWHCSIWWQREFDTLGSPLTARLVSRASTSVEIPASLLRASNACPLDHSLLLPTMCLQGERNFHEPAFGARPSLFYLHGQREPQQVKSWEAEHANTAVYRKVLNPKQRYEYHPTIYLVSSLRDSSQRVFLLSSLEIPSHTQSHLTALMVCHRLDRNITSKNPQVGWNMQRCTSAPARVSRGYGIGKCEIPPCSSFVSLYFEFAHKKSKYDAGPGRTGGLT